MKFFVLISLCALGVFGAVQAANMNLVMLTDAPSQGAVCIDGTAPGYYYRPGTGHDATNFIIHLEGGGWCNSLDSCLSRSKTNLGSSKAWPKSLGVAGFLSDSTTTNPMFAQWSVVYVPYCDGGSFSGLLTDPVQYKGTKMYFRGKYILDAVLADLNKNHGLQQAASVILTGCSAGGLATYLHADYVHTRLNSATTYHAVPDAGYFLDAANVEGVHQYAQEQQWVFATMNSTHGVNDACIKDKAEKDQWQCFFAPYVLPYIESNLFMVNAEYDSWQLANILHLDCNPDTTCNTTQLEMFQHYREQTMKAAQPITTASSDSGAFLDACVVHCQTLSDSTWDGFKTEKGTSLRESVEAWYSGQKSAANLHIDGAPWPENKSCHK